MLEVSVRQLNNMVRAGTLHPEYPEGKGFRSPRFFREDEVVVAIELKDMKMDLPQLAVLARQAYVSSRQTERLLRQVMHFTGADVPMLSHKRRDVFALYLKVEDELDAHRDFKPENILEWARTFYAVGEEYLWLIEQVVEDPEPWKKMLDLASKICKEAPRGEFPANRALATAYGFLEAGRRNLRNVAYFYIRSHHGERLARKAFSTSLGDITDRHINIAFPDQKF